MKKDTNPKGTPEAVGACFQGTKGKWSLHILPFDAVSTGNASSHTIQCFGKRTMLADADQQAMQLLAQSVTEVALAATRTIHQHPTAPAAHPITTSHPPQVLPGHSHFDGSHRPMHGNGASHVHSMAAMAASNRAAQHATMAAARAHGQPTPPPPPPPPPPPESAQAGSAAPPAEACMQDAAPADLAPTSVVSAGPRTAVRTRSPQAPATQRLREDTPEPSPRAIPFAQSASAHADGAAARDTPAAAVPRGGVDRGLPPPLPSPLPDEPGSAAAAAGAAADGAQRAARDPPQGAATQPLCSIANRMVNIITASANAGPTRKPPPQRAAGNTPLRRPRAASAQHPAMAASPASPHQMGVAAGVAPLTPPPQQGSPSQPQWKLSASPRQGVLSEGPAGPDNHSELQDGMCLGAELQRLLPPALATPPSSTAASPGRQQELGSPVPPAPPGTDMQLREGLPTELQQPEVPPTGHGAEVQATELQLPVSVQATELHATQLQETEVQATEMLETEVQATELLQTEFPATELQAPEQQASELQATESPQVEQQPTELQSATPSPTELQKSEVQLTELQQTDSQDTELQHVALQPSAAQPAPAQHAESQPLQVQPADHHAHLQPAPPQAAEQLHTPPRNGGMESDAHPQHPVAGSRRKRSLPASLQPSEPALSPRTAAAPPSGTTTRSPAVAPSRRQTRDRAVQTAPPPAPRPSAWPPLSTSALAPPEQLCAAPDRRRASAPACEATPAKRPCLARPGAPNTEPRAQPRPSSVAVPRWPAPATLPPLPAAPQPMPRAQRRELCIGGQNPQGAPANGAADRTMQAAHLAVVPRSKAAIIAARVHRNSTAAASEHPLRRLVRPRTAPAASRLASGPPEPAGEPGRRSPAMRMGVGASAAVAEGPRLACFPGRDVSVMAVRAALLRGECPPPPPVAL